MSFARGEGKVGSLMSSNILKKQNVGIAAAVLVLVATCFIPGTTLLPREGVLMLGIFGVAAILWICESLPMGITGLLALTLVVVFGIAPIGEAFSGFSTPTMFYLLAAFSFAAIVGQTSYGKRLVIFLMKRTKGRSSLIVLAFMVAAALLSSIMSDTAVVLMFLGFAKGVADALECKPQESNFAKCLFIGLLYGAIVGGFATVAGGPNNMAVLQIAGLSVGFLDWMKVGVPVTLFILPVCWLSVVKAFPPEQFSREKVDEIIGQTRDIGKATVQEKKALVFVIALPTLWIAGNWVPALNVTIVALLGLVVAFLPGVRLLTWKQYQESVPWVVLLMVGSVFSMSSLMAKTGVINFIGSLVSATGVSSLAFPAALLLYLLFAYGVFTICPVNGVWESLFVPVLAGLCAQMGISPTVAPLAILFAFGGNFLLPINPLNMYSYAYGYFKFGDMFKAGIVPALVLILFDAFWTPFIIGAWGL